MRIKHFLIAYMTVFMFTACNEDIFTENIPDIQSAVMKINVRDQFSENTTRANYTGFPATTFEAGDEIGIYAFDGNTYVASNVRYTKQSDGSWLADSDIRYNEDYTYYAYFPYRSTTYTPSTAGGVSDIDTKFTNFINDASNYFWQADQSTKEGYTYSNLMIAKGNVTIDNDTPTVSFTMLHKRGLAIFTDDAKYARFTGNIPCQIDDTKQFLMKPGVATSFTDNTGTYTLTAQESNYINRKIEIDWSKEYLTFYVLEDGTFTFTNGLYYSLDDGATWITLTGNTASPTFPAGTKILLKGPNAGYSTTQSNGCGSFISTMKFDVMGNIMSLYSGANFANATTISKNYYFAHFFSKLNGGGAAKIINAKNLVLPATILTEECYNAMFTNCKTLITAPKILPATTLAKSCYYYMFKDCSNLITIPELPATSLAQYCYCGMFSGCSSLTVGPKILPATTLALGCYKYMFRETLLEIAPELPAETLLSYCYDYMFYGCTRLKYIKAAAKKSIGSDTSSKWVQSVGSNGVFYKNAAATWTTTGENGVPSGWTVVTYTP